MGEEPKEMTVATGETTPFFSKVRDVIANPTDLWCTSTCAGVSATDADTRQGS